MNFLFFIFHFFGLTKRITEGETLYGRKIKEGQRWNLKKNIDKGLKKGVFVVGTYMGERIWLPREDGRHDLPIGCVPYYEIDILDNPNFELLEGTNLTFN